MSVFIMATNCARALVLSWCFAVLAVAVVARPTGRLLLQGPSLSKPATGLPAKPAGDTGVSPVGGTARFAAVGLAPMGASPPKPLDKSKGSQVYIAVAALNVTGTLQEITNSTSATFFAPTDTAFASLASQLNLSVAELLANPLARNMTLLHIIPGVRLRSADVKQGEVLKEASLLGPELILERHGRNFFVRVAGTDVFAQIIRADVPFNQVIVHVINKVLT